MSIWVKKEKMLKIISNKDDKSKNFDKACGKQGSLTVEAAIAVPIFVFFMAIFLSLFRVLLIESQVDQAASYTAHLIAAGDNGNEIDTDYAKALLIFKSVLRNSGIDKSSIKGSIPGIKVTMPETDSNKVTIRANYEIKLLVPAFGKEYVKLTSHASARKWNGYTRTADTENADEDSWVYVTPTGTAYHQSTSCRYLDLTIQAVSRSTVADMRNKSGGKYYPCSSCHASNATGTVYITDYGTEYHVSTSCSRLKRTVSKIKLSQVGSRHACNKCYG